MKFIPFPAFAFCLMLSSCGDMPMGGVPGPPMPGPVPGGNNLAEQQDKAFNQGFGFGRRDANLGKPSNPLLYNNYYNSQTKNHFTRGYYAGYRKGGR
ncbi:hypothetical protein [Luteolibacter marinus]|uniref:hypothetical protein n=1 Tax=Luteolibacter marinus TaxID=2776705 RepID=UPI001867267C|nr:hypothetical protein [Luteolibacter marinus]